MRAASRSVTSRSRACLLALGLVLLGACEPSGPGALTGTVQAPVATGAVIVELTGTGITGFEGVGGVRTLPTTADPLTSSHRVIVVSPSGALRFRVLVEDVGGLAPRAVVVSAVDVANLPIESLAGFSLRISR